MLLSPRDVPAALTFEPLLRFTADHAYAAAAYERDQDIPPRLVDVMQGALREYLTRRGYLQPSSARLRRKPTGVPRDRAVRIEGPDNLAAAVIEDRR